MPHKTPEERSRYNKAWKLKHRYGITLEQYEAMVEEQGNCCKICGKHRSAQKNDLAVDHCHRTGAVRSLLCVRCNAILGEINEFEGDKLDKLIKYLEAHHGEAS